MKSGKELLRIAADIRRSKETQSELGMRYNLDRRWISRLKFIAQADFDTRLALSRLSQSAIKRIVDDVRSKTVGRTMATRLDKLSQAVRSISIYNISTKNAAKVERARHALLNERHANRELREESRDLNSQLSDLQEKYSKVRKAAIYYKNRAQQGSAQRHPSQETDPNLIHVIDMLRSKYGVHVNINGARLEFDCMSKEILAGTLEKLSSPD